MNELLLKYNQLDEVSKLSAMDFINFLFEKKVKTSTDLTEYKKKILNVSQWSEEDIDEFEKNKDYLNNWTISQW